ncbi:hypothetical protein B0T19DRAFT_457854 [Cercophora scortea]|uniref:Uncharacterized protein n=1 Tax=Cercophora scortea TaxID=314031 RepID=A0AAE0MHN5_9PEZI|nr:hypothetical protein B0T19DRAFT_457854 [Cercophora scortea]
MKVLSARKTPRDVRQSYDYVIIGGGTAGLTVADRLTEDGKTTVLVIEHGPLSDSSDISTIDGGFFGMGSSFFYNIDSVPQVHLNNRTTAVRIGDVVGGGSAVNAMMTIRGTVEDYDRWGSFFGGKNPAWTFKGLLPYFKRAVNFVPPAAAVTDASRITYDTSYWGNSSRVYAGWPSWQYPGTTAQLDAFKSFPGVEFPKDSGSGETGVYWYPTFMDPVTVTRSYAKTGHYSGINRSNYHLITESKVTKILLCGTTAIGVSFTAVNGSSNVTIVKADKEVILSAGGIHSPQLLQLSGIGPRKILAAANITTRVDLPGVGQNFQDHPMLYATWTYKNFSIHPSPEDRYTNATFAAWADSAFAFNRTGPLAIATGNAGAWLPFSVVSPRAAALSAALLSQNHTSVLPPDTHPSVAAGYAAQMASLATAMLSTKTSFYNMALTGGETNGLIVNLHPLSRGTVNIDPVDPHGKEPIVDYRALSNPLDVSLITDIYRFARRYHMENPLTAAWGAVEDMPGKNVTTDEQWREYIAEAISPSLFHPAGTCAMLPKELGGVVDEELRVYGVGRLRVVDASVFPTLPGANTCQTVYAVAEKAADMIRAGGAGRMNSSEAMGAYKFLTWSCPTRA